MPRTTQRRKSSSAIRMPFRILAVLIGLMGLVTAVVDWRSFPVFTAVMGMFFLIAGVGGDEGAGFLDRCVNDVMRAIAKAVGWCWRQVGKLTGRKAEDATPAWLGDEELPTLEVCGEQAASLLEADSDLVDEPFEREPHHTALDLLRQLYAHDRCDWFAVALREATGWPVVGAASPGEYPAHRLNRDPQGRLVDAYGHVTLDDLRWRYGIDDLEIVDHPEIAPDLAPSPSDLPCIAAAMLHLPTEPFVSMRDQIEAWVRYGRRVGEA
jgi:hypothetical protein